MGHLVFRFQDLTASSDLETLLRVNWLQEEIAPALISQTVIGMQNETFCSSVVSLSLSVWQWMGSDPTHGTLQVWVNPHTGLSQVGNILKPVGLVVCFKLRS